VVLRPKKFRRFETAILFAIALLLIGAGIVGAVIAVRQMHWRLGLASAGVLVLSIVYFCAVKRGKPL